MAEFAMIGTAIAVLALIILQLTIAAYVRVIAVDCAGVGARYGALRGSSPQEGAERADAAIAQALGPRFSGSAHADVVQLGGHRQLTVMLAVPMPVVGLWGPRTMVVSGHAVMEE